MFQSPFLKINRSPSAHWGEFLIQFFEVGHSSIFPGISQIQKTKIGPKTCNCNFWSWANMGNAAYSWKTA